MVKPQLSTLLLQSRDPVWGQGLIAVRWTWRFLPDSKRLVLFENQGPRQAFIACTMGDGVGREPRRPGSMTQMKRGQRRDLRYGYSVGY